jgi:hypothetical protein
VNPSYTLEVSHRRSVSKEGTWIRSKRGYQLFKLSQQPDSVCSRLMNVPAPVADDTKLNKQTYVAVLAMLGQVVAYIPASTMCEATNLLATFVQLLCCVLVTAAR